MSGLKEALALTQAVLDDYNKRTETTVAAAAPVLEPEPIAAPVQAAPAPKSAPKAAAFDKFIPYDPNNSQHREVATRLRVEYDGFYLIRAQASESELKTIEATFLREGRYPIGVVPRGGSLLDAYFPAQNSRVPEEFQWLQRAMQLRDWVIYDDALYAEWDDPQPVAGELKPVLQFNPDWLPHAVRPYVVDIGERMAVPVDFPAVCSIVCLAGAVSHRAFTFPKLWDKDFAEPLCISGAVIADSGKKKTPTWKMLMNPLTEWEHEEDEAYQKRMMAYRDQLAAIDALKQDVDDYNKDERKLAKKEKREPVLKDYSEIPPTPSEPVKPRRLVVNDSTPEQVHEIAKSNPQGLMYFRDELSGWAAELDMIGREGARSMFLQGMTGDHDHTVDRIGREGGYAKMTLSVFGSFQPHLFVNFFSEARNVADGTIPRLFCLIWPDSVRLPLLDRQTNTVAKAIYRQVVRRLADLPDKSVSIHMDKEAQPLFLQFLSDLDDKVWSEKNPGKKSHLSKYAGGLARLAALLQLVDTVASLKESPKLSEVDAETGKQISVMVVDPVPSDIFVDLSHLQNALQMLQYFESHMHRVYDSKLSGLEYVKVRLIEHLKDGSIHDDMTARDISQKGWAGLSRKVTSADSIDAALVDLAQLGWVRLVPVKPGQGAGRHARKWLVNPAAREA